MSWANRLAASRWLPGRTWAYTVIVTTGPGPGPKTLPASEATALISHRLAVYGDRAPGDVAPETAIRAYPHLPGHKVAVSN